MSKNKLHTLSKYEADRLNRIAFMPDERKNLFVWAGPLNSATNQKTFGNNTTGNILSGYNTNSTGVGSNVFNSTPAMQQAMNNVFPTPILQDYTATPFQRRDIGPKVDNVKKTTFSDSFKIPNITINSSNDGKTFSIKEAFGKDALKAAGKTALNAGIGIAGNLVGQGAKAAISGGRSSDIGNGISSLGSTVGGAVGMANPLLGAAITAGSGVLGGLWNGAFGAKWNKENIADVENNIAQMRATDLGSVNSNAALLDAWGQVNLGYDFDQNYIGKNGWLNHKATRKYNKLNAMQKAARAYVQHQLGVAADQADRTQDDLAQSTFIYSDGGFLDNLDTSDMGEATKYSLAQDYLTMKNNKINTDAKIANMYAGTPDTFFAEGGPLNVLCGGGKMFAIGGDMQTNGGDFSTGLSHVNAGLSHELNPNEGVQVGVDLQGIPNLVEEGEVIWNDYVFSARIGMDDESKEVFHVNKKRDITYADQAKRLEREIKERPNDPISKAAFNAQMEKLQEQQERQKAEMEAQRAQEAFAALSPEEQTAVMQQVAQQEQAAQDAAIQEQAAQEQAIAEQQAMQGQPTPEEAQMMQQEQMMQAEPQIEQQPAIQACGGKINKFDKGGKKNAGSWKKGNSATNWMQYSSIGLKSYLQNILNRVNNAKTDEEKNNIRQEAINTVRDIQQAYRKAYQNELSPVSESEAVKTLQTLFQNAGGNEGFTNIADNINIPAGANTADRVDRGWVDSLWGPRTSIRNWGSTEYDLDYGDIAKLASQAGLKYAPITDWTYGNTDNPYTLYGLSLPEVDTRIIDPNTPDTPAQEEKVSIVPEDAVNGKPAVDTEVTTKPGEPVKKYAYRPNLVEETNLGMYGPLVNLGMMAAGIGKPDYTELDKALAIANRPVKLASYQPIGDYIKYRPMDIWAAQNRMDANARATDRAIMNSTSPSNQAALLANAYTSQLGSGELFRQSLEYNDNLKKQVADFNRGTNIQNANAFNQLSQFNASQLNADKQRRAYMAANIVGQKMDADASWYNSLYGNVNSMFTNIANREREIRDRNWMAKMAADGLLGNLGDSYTGQGLITKYEVSAKDGGKLKRKKNKKKGLTI